MLSGRGLISVTRKWVKRVRRYRGLLYTQHTQHTLYVYTKRFCSIADKVFTKCARGTRVTYNT